MKNLIAIFIVLIFLGCNSAIEKPNKPDNLISEAKMVDIMYDVYLLNAAKGVNKKILEKNGIMPEKYVFEKYGIDSVQFVNSNNYYAYDTKTYESILERIKIKLSTEKKKYEAIEEAEEQDRARRADSLMDVRKRQKDSVLDFKEIKPLSTQ